MKKNFFNITNEDFFDKTKIKVLDGIAGSAKSSNVDKIFKENGIEYGKFTSTNKLKRDAENRFGGHVDTIAGGLFKTNNGVFFDETKDAEFENIVIDEILQTDYRVFEWVAKNVGKTNIVICTDSCQMLSPECEGTMMEKYKEFIKREDVIYIELTKTYRARNEKTKRYFEECYESVKNGISKFEEAKNVFRTISFEDMPYNKSDVYICHTNAIEDMLYDKFRIGDDYDNDLIPKGVIAKKIINDVTRYPILSQNQSNGKKIGYFQPERVGSATRYQGSEVNETKTLYFIVESTSRVEAREWYTVISRCYNIDSIVIVITKTKKIEPLKAFNGKSVKKKGWYRVEDMTLSDGRKLSEIEKKDGKIEIPLKDMITIRKSIKDTEEIHFLSNAFLFNGNIVTQEQENDEEEKTKSNKITMNSLLSKEPDFDYDYIPSFYRSVDIAAKRLNVEVEGTIAPTYRQERNDEMNKYGYKNDLTKFKYEIDFEASYPHILKYAKLPIGSNFYGIEDAGETSIARNDPLYNTEIEETNLFDWYIVEGSSQISDGAIVSGDIVRYLQSSGDTGRFSYVGSSESKIGSRMGETLLSKAHESVESKEEVKDVHYGLAERSFLNPIYEKGIINSYFVENQNNHKLLIVAVKNQQLLNILKVKNVIYRGGFGYGWVIADALFFDYEGDIEELGEKIRKELPNYDFRIRLNDGTKTVLYKTYEDLKTRSEIRKEKDKERKRLARAKKKAES